MGDQNSQWFCDLAEQIIVDMYTLVSSLLTSSHLPSPRLLLERERDITYLRRRVSGEGLAFLTTALPRYGKWVDGMLGCKELPVPEGFAPYREDKTPRFLHMIVDTALRTESDNEERQAQLIRALRTFLFAFYKLEVPYTRDQERLKLQSFIDIESEMETSPPDFEGWFYLQHTCERVLDGFNLRDEAGRVLDEVRPKHGPGAVASGEKLERKWEFTHLYASLHKRFPYYDFMYGARQDGRATMLADMANEYRKMIREDTPTAKLVSVPKDSRGPRLISSEPLEVQYIQQGVSKLLVRFLERKSCVAGHINFTDQGINQALATSSSRDGRFATLDLSEASDRVALSVVKIAIPPRLWEDLVATRSTHTALPHWFAEETGLPVRFPLKKYAPMGSALCFPIESVIFFSACVSALLLLGWSWDDAVSNVYVYGDDLIVPNQCTVAITRFLASIGLKVNQDKSYWEGNFRESCGADAWKGHLVSPVRVRKFPPVNVRQSDSAAAHAAYVSQLWSAGLCGASDYILEYLRSIFGFVPEVSEPQGFLSVTRSLSEPEVRNYPGFKAPSAGQLFPTARLWRIKSPKRPIQLESWRRLNRFFAEPRLEETDTVVVPGATQIVKARCKVYLNRAGLP